MITCTPFGYGTVYDLGQPPASLFHGIVKGISIGALDDEIVDIPYLIGIAKDGNVCDPDRR